MLGRDHALSGAVVFAALAPSLHVTAAHLAAGVVLAAGAGVLPDIDHPDSTISRSFGFLTEWFAWVVDRLSGGHRHGTHSILGIAVFTAGAYGAGLFQLSGPASIAHGHLAFSWHIVPAALILALLYSAALRALKLGGHHGDLLGIAAAAVTCFTGADLTQQANDYSAVVQDCLAVSRCVGVSQWGVGDADSWIPGAFPGFGAATMYDQNYQPKPSYTSTQQALGG